VVAVVVAGLVIGCTPLPHGMTSQPEARRPVLLVSSSDNPFGAYYAEILRAEGLDVFSSADISTVSASTLSGHDLVVLAEMPLTPTQASVLAQWVDGGGSLVAMRPSKNLARLLGLTDASATLADAYMRVDAATSPVSGIVDQTIQFHGAADLYWLSGARAVASLYADASTPTPHPAVALTSVGANGGQAAAFTYDLARSVVYTRQGNPAWSGQERDGLPPVRANDLFFGAADLDPQPDWIDLSKVAIPQADEQQRLLVNLILTLNRRKTPLPRFWYFPRGHRAVIVMTGDDHGTGDPAGRFELYQERSPAGCTVTRWECIRSTAYIYTATRLTDAQAAAYEAEGFEIALHVTTGCKGYTPAQLDLEYGRQLREFRAKYVSLQPPSTIRIHCGSWSDYATQPRVAFKHGIRFDTNYYYWPGSWIADRPGMFTGSGLPMRFARADGAIIDVYQAATQLTDESGQTYPATVETLLDNALGPAGFYGAFTVNVHTDPSAPDPGSIVEAALRRRVPIVSARQMLAWLDGRNGSSFDDVEWNGEELAFRLGVGAGARDLLWVMVPRRTATRALQAITHDAAPVAYTTGTVKGVEYALFPGANGLYRARFTAYP
jgi:hypothetical protein